MSIDRKARGDKFLAGVGQAAVAGLGRSGQAAAALLLRCGVPVTLIDSRPREQLAGDLDLLLEPAGGPRPAAGFVQQDQAASALAAADLVVLSPGIDPRKEPFASLVAGEVTVISEIELAFRFAQAPVLAVTGSNGKSTVASLLGAVLAAAGLDARVCGNIGAPFCEALAGQTPATRFVVEVSSFQLERTLSFAPDVALLLNITPDHQDRYDTHADYVAAKERLFRYMTSGQAALIGVDDPGAAEVARRLVADRPEAEASHRPRLIPFALSEEICAPSDPSLHDGEAAFIRAGRFVVTLSGVEHDLGPADSLPLPGPHNRSNALAVLAAALCAGADPAGLADALAGFQPLAHRLEPVGTFHGVTWVNDSKATNLDSARMALRSFPAGRVILILGGKDKGADFSALVPDLKERARLVLAIGQAAERIAGALQPALEDSVAVEVLPGMSEAVREAARVARPGDVVLLAPACASFDAYGNFQERGEHFRSLAQQQGGEHGP